MQTWTCIYHFLSSCSADVLSAILKDISVSRCVALTINQALLLYSLLPSLKTIKHCSYTLSSPPFFSLFPLPPLLSPFPHLHPISASSSFFLPSLFPFPLHYSLLSPLTSLLPLPCVFPFPLLPSLQPHCNDAKSTGLPSGGGSHANGGSPHAEAPGHLCHIFPSRGCHAPDEDPQRCPPQNASHAQTGNHHTPYHTFFHHLYRCC